MAEPDEPDRTEPSRSGPGLSAGGWAAVAALGAAAITGVVTLVTHFLPANEALDPQTASVASPTSAAATAVAGVSPVAEPAPASSEAAAPRSVLIDRFVGTWSGPAQSGSQRFTMTLVITPDCVEGGPCGTLTTDLLPCVGNVSLVKIDDGPALDLAVGSYSSDSSGSCATTTGGDYFKLGDDVLTYATGYDGGLRGTLHRVG